jgi:hypothetical protein
VRFWKDRKKSISDLSMQRYLSKSLRRNCLAFFRRDLSEVSKTEKHEGKFLYSKMPLAIGVFEAQVDKISKETAEL